MAYTTIKKPSDYFNTLLHTGDGTDGRGITGVGFQPDLTWFKSRSAAYESQVYDIIRGATKKITTTDSGAEGTQANGLQSFDSDGFTVGNANATNVNSVTYASWNWLASNTTASNTDGSITSTVSANTTSGFSIVSYTGNGTAGATIGHGLGSAPSMVIVKQLNDTGSWVVYHKSQGATKYGIMDTTSAFGTSSSLWNDTAPTNSVFSLGSDGDTNGASQTFVAYCFAEKKGFSKFGSYTGNGNADGTFIYTGFKPAFILIKKTSVASWYINDNKRSSSGGFNVSDEYLRADLSNGTGTDQNGGDFVSNGFKLRNSDTDYNISGATYIYMAIAEEPLVGDNPATAR
jgi:hypothetical protein